MFSEHNTYMDIVIKVQKDDLHFFVASIHFLAEITIPVLCMSLRVRFVGGCILFESLDFTDLD